MANAVPTVLVVLIAATSCLADPKLPEPKKGVIVKSNGHVFINNSAVAADCFVVSVDLGILEPAIFQYAFEFFLQALPGGAEVAGKPVSGVLQNIANEFSTIYVFEKPDGTPVKIAPGGRVRVNAVIDEKGANKFRWGSNAKFCRIIPGEDDPQELPTIRAKVLVLKAKDGNSTDYILFNQGETSQETHIEQLAFAFGPVSTDLEKLGDIEELGEVQHFFGPGNEGWVINGDPFGDPDDFFDDLSMIAVNVPGSIPSGEALIIEGHGTNLTTGEPVFFRQLHEVVPGACCRPDGVCVSVTGDECNKVGGDFFGAGSECAGSVAAAVIQDPFDGPCLEWQHSINDSVESLEAGFNEGKYVISELAPIDGARSFPVQRLRREIIAPNKYAAELTMEWAEANDGDPNQAFVSEIVVKDTNDFTLGWVGLNDTSEPAGGPSPWANIVGQDTEFGSPLGTTGMATFRFVGEKVGENIWTYRTFVNDELLLDASTDREAAAFEIHTLASSNPGVPFVEKVAYDHFEFGATGQVCFADCNSDGFLNILDFVCFQSLFVVQNLSADCNGDGEWSILDFICFQEAFQQGCD